MKSYCLLVVDTKVQGALRESDALAGEFKVAKDKKPTTERTVYK